MGEEEGFGALGIERDLYLVVLRHLIAIDARDRTDAKNTVGDPVAGVPDPLLLPLKGARDR